MPRSTRRGPGPPRARSAATPLKTTESRVTALGDAIREHPGYSPILLPETPNGIGTAAVTLAAGTGPSADSESPRSPNKGQQPRRCHDGVAACRACSAGTSRLGQQGLADGGFSCFVCYDRLIESSYEVMAMSLIQSNL